MERRIRSSRLRVYTRFCLIAVVILATQMLALAQSAQSTARPDRGVRPNGSYSVSEIENINLTNGNLNLSIPLASLPPMAGGRLSHGIEASYNSKIWDVKRDEFETGGFPNGRYVREILQVSDNSGWQIGAGYGIFFQSPAAYDYGWLGPEITDLDHGFFTQQPYGGWAKVILRTPDGTTHELRPLDFTPYQASARDFLWGYYWQTPNKIGAPMRYYSFDGSFIWAVINPSSSNIKWEVYFPDGTHIVQRSAFQRIRDANGNRIKIFTEETSPGSLTTHIQDEESSGVIREVKIISPAGSSTQQVQYQTVGGSWVSIDVVWGTTLVQGQTYNDKDHGGTGQVCDVIRRFDESLFVVREIILPQTEAGLPRQKFTFSYNSDAIDHPSNIFWTDCNSPGQQFPITTSSHGWGSLSRMTTPSGAQVDYDYDLNGEHWLLSANEAARERIKTKDVTHDGTTDTWQYFSATPFGTVIGPDGSRTLENIYPTDPAYPSQYGSPNGLGGLTFKTVRFLNGQPNITTERHWIRLLFNGGNDVQPGSLTKAVFNAVVDAEYTTLHNASGSPVKMSAKTFQYDFNGNVIETREYDWFAPNLVARDPNNQNLPTGVPASATLLKVTTSSYHSQADGMSSTNIYAKRAIASPPVPFILNAVKETSSGNGSVTLSKSRFHYDNQGFNALPTAGNVTKERRDNGGVWIDVNHTYDLKGNRTSTTDPRNNLMQYFYEDQTLAQPTRIVVDPNNQVTGDEHTSHIVYDYYTGLATSQTDPNGQVTSTDYTNQLLGSVDPFGRPGRVIAPHVAVNINGQVSTQRRIVVTKYFDTARQVESFSDLNAENDAKLRARTTKDQLERIIRTESSENGSTYTLTAETVYEQMGRITYTSNPRRSGASQTDGWTRTTSDDLGRVVEVATFTGATRPAATATNWNGRVQSSYFANETTVTDQAGKVRRSLTDALMRLIRVDEPDANGNLGTSSAPVQATGYVYDALGNLLQVNQGNQQRLFTYDNLSRMRTAKNPEQVNSSSVMVATVYDYDDASNLITRTNPNNTTVSFTYDGLNRVKTKTISTGIWTYSYDTGTNGKGRLVSVTKGTEGYFYDGYDSAGRVTSSHQVTNLDGVDRSYSMSYGYDLAGNVTSQIYPSGKEYRTNLDAAGRISDVKRYVGGVFDKTYASQFQYTPHGGISSMAFGNNTTETMAYNSRLQPLMIELRKTDNSLLLGLDYTYNTVGQANNNGNVLTQSIRFLHQGNTVTINQSYGYDSLNRLRTASETGSWSQTYDYDRWGNRWVSQSIGYAVDANLCPTQQSHISGANNRITLGGFSYDASGNQKTQIRNSQNETLDYDSENRMTGFTSGSSATSYTYDGDGRRVKKITAAQKTIFVYNVAGQMVAEYATPALPPEGGGGTSYLTSDHLGSTRVVTDAQGNVKSRHDYLPFGEELGASTGQRTVAMKYSAADSTRQRFTDYERDIESGLDYAKNRYYSSAQGRFTTVDPTLQSAELNDPQTWNRYVYVSNNPLRFVDPLGLWSLEVIPIEEEVEVEEDGQKKKKKKIVGIKIVVKKSKDGDNAESLLKQLGIDKNSDQGKQLMGEIGNKSEVRLSELGGEVGDSFDLFEGLLMVQQTWTAGGNPGGPSVAGYQNCAQTCMRMAFPGQEFTGDFLTSPVYIDSLLAMQKNISQSDVRFKDIVRFANGSNTGTHYANVIFKTDQGALKTFSRSGQKGKYEVIDATSLSADYGAIQGAASDKTGYYSRQEKRK